MGGYALYYTENIGARIAPSNPSRPRAEDQATDHHGSHGQVFLCSPTPEIRDDPWLDFSSTELRARRPRAGSRVRGPGIPARESHISGLLLSYP